MVLAAFAFATHPRRPNLRLPLPILRGGGEDPLARIIVQANSNSVSHTVNGTFYAFLLIGAFLVVAAIIAQFGIATRGQKLDGVSP
jgi:hypothetical protein